MSFFCRHNAAENFSHVLFKISALVTTNTAGNSAGVSFKISTFGATEEQKMSCCLQNDPVCLLADVVLKSSLDW